MTKTNITEKWAIFAPAEGIPSVVNLLDPEFGSELANLQFAVGGYVQAVSLAQDFEGFVIWLNEEAKLIPDMLPNELMTSVWRESFKGYRWGADDYILGNAVITLEADSNGETVGMTKEQAERITEDFITLRSLMMS
jgi:hypothetical protein